MQAKLTSTLGSRLRQARDESGLTRKWVAERLQISVAAISYWERGETMPTLENLIELARIYRKSLDWLVGNEILPSAKYSMTFTPETVNF